MIKKDLSGISCKAANVDEAIAYAQKLQKNEFFDLFRGQIHDFPIRSSIFREGNNLELCQTRLNRLANWIHTKPELKSVHFNEDAILAIAQHYGIPTPLLDFTSDPKVAGFFATEGKLPSNRKDKDALSCIICVNRKTFEKSWSNFNKLHKKDSKREITRIIEIDVQNLWRLQTQKGLFIQSYADPAFLEMFSHFFRIYFPYSGPPKDISRQMIYPEKKSHLELLLDQFFSDETRENAQKDVIEKIFAGVFIDKSIEPFYGDPTIFKRKKFPSIHKSWIDEYYKQWLLEPNETFSDAISNKKFLININCKNKPKKNSELIYNQILKKLQNNKELRNRSFYWEILDKNGKSLTVDDENEMNDNETYKQIECSELVSIIWDGMRRLPFSDEQISHSIANYLAIAANPNSDRIGNFFGDSHWIEFDAGSFIGMGCASEKKLQECLRDDVFKYVNPQHIDTIKNSNFGIAGEFLRSVTIPAKLFNFKNFVNLFAYEIIPTQVIFNMSYKSFCFSPAQVKFFGHR